MEVGELPWLFVSFSSRKKKNLNKKPPANAEGFKAFNLFN